MKAAQIETYGGAELVKVVDIDQPLPAAGQVLVEVYASSINPWDSIVRDGLVQDFMPLQLPLTLGGDLAGIVVALGDDVTTLAIGDEVYGGAGAPNGSGAFAEFAVASASSLAKKPAGIDFTEAAAIVLTGQSAIQVIQGHLNLQAGQKILIHGGAGGIGSVAIQLAKHSGAYVATTATGDGLDFVRTLGADEVIDYKSQQFEDVLHDYDAVFDNVGGETYQRSFRVLKKGGTVVSMREQPNNELMERYGVTAIYQSSRTDTDSLTNLAKLIEDKVITVHVDKVFPLEQIVEAFTARETGSIKGKVAVRIKN